MNENKENTANETVDLLAVAEGTEAQEALLAGFADEQDDLFGADETDLSEADPDEAGSAEFDPFGEDELILEAEAEPEPENGVLQPENTAEGRSPNGADGMGGAGGAAGANGANGADNAAGRSGRNSETAAPDNGTGKAADGANEAAAETDTGADTAGTAEKNADNTAETAAQPGEEPRYKVQLYGREQELTASQLVAAAQKGLDYDNMRTQLAAAQQALPALRLVEQYAAANGMTAGQYLEAAGQNIQRQAVNELTQKGVPEQTARELVAERLRLEEERRVIAPLMQRLNAEEARKKARDPWLAVTREYPDVVNLPESVLLSVQKGETPLAAMRAWELEQLRAKLSAQEMQLSAQAATLKNRQTAPGSAAGAADTRRDPFLDALFSAD